MSFAIVLVALAAIQDYLSDLTASPQSMVVVANQNENNRSLADLLGTRRSIRANLIEYDGESAKFLISLLLERGAHVEVLLQHPDSAVNEQQRRRTILQVLSVREQYFDCLDRVTFLYYREQAALRGRRIDDWFLCVGWYTYDRRDSTRGPQVWGHNNPLVECELRSTAGNVLLSFFDQVFDNLKLNAVKWEVLEAELQAESANSGQ